MKLSNFLLSTRIIIAAITLVVTVGMALLFIENARLREVYINEQRSDLQHSREAVTLQFNQAINILRQDVLFLSNTPPVSGIVRATLNHGYDSRYNNTRKVWEERLQQIFSAFSKARPDYYQIRYIGMADRGREIVRVDNRSGVIEITPPARLQAKGDRDYFKATLGQHSGEVYLSEFTLNQERGVIEQLHRPMLRAATTVFTPSGQVFGMVVINMDVSSLLKSAAKDLPAGALSYITNMNGEYLLHPDVSRSFGFKLGSKDNIITDLPFLETIFNRRTPEHLSLQTTEPGIGIQYLDAGRIHFDPSDPARFLVLARVLPTAVVENLVPKVPPRQIAGGLIVILLVSGISLLILRRTFAPLTRITVAAREITAGDRQTRLAETGSGEISELANALNHMLDELSENELIKQEIAFRKSIIDTTQDGFWQVDAQGNLLDTNQAYADISGYARDELVGMHISQLEAKEQTAEAVEAHIAKVIATGHDLFETRHRHKDGHEIDIEVSTTFIRDAQEFVVFCRDITKRKQIESSKLRESEDRFRGTLEQAAVGIVHATLDGLYLQVNEKFCTIVGYSRDELMHMGFRDITYSDDLDKDLACVQQMLSGEISTFTLEKRYVRKDKTLVWVNLTVSMLRNDSGTPRYFIGVVEDITERKRAEQQLRELSAHLQIVREEEKAKIAREIHDNLGGTLTALKMDVYWLADELPPHTGTSMLLEHIELMSNLLDNAVEVTRNIITDLRPTILDDLGLQAAFEWQAGQFYKRTGIQCLVNCTCIECCNDKLDKIQTINLFRIFQESLTNVARHSGASSVEVEFQYEDEDGEIILAIFDNGCGLPEGHTIARTSYGMLGMRERVEQMGGRISFYSPPGGGFSVTVILPLHNQHQGRGET